ncbi:LRR receptor-like kinase family protein [Trifolium pratense]|uniref:non-specific serine/threonine protein kinase n=1 Tax=Trifolium pratense TaxID=57577 RepID=A0A2K3PLB0_TRIPR|nr:LRR receptor-like kinase family protein [Trifolium pratense]
MSSNMSGSARHSVLDWPKRLRIAIGIDHGLCYMHHDCSPPMVCATTKLNEKIDVFSFGVILLELTAVKEATYGVARVECDCLDGVLPALHIEDYEAAARYVHSRLSNKSTHSSRECAEEAFFYGGRWITVTTLSFLGLFVFIDHLEKILSLYAAG